MANRRFYQFRLSLEPQVVDLYLHASFGASGAVTLDAAQSRGIKSMTHSGAGTYTIHFQDAYNRLLMIDKMSISGAAAAAQEMRLYDDSSSNNSDPSVTVVFSAAGVDTNPASGESVRMQFSLKNSNA